MAKPLESPAQLKARLGALAYHVTQEHGTERAHTSPLATEWQADAQYRCVVCGEMLFTAAQQFNAGCGWPSFDAPATPLAEHTDRSHGMTRTEVRCPQCAAHLGHVFDDGPADTTGLRYCINGVALQVASSAP